MPRLRLGPDHALIYGLRQARSETELTRALANVLGAKPGMAGDFVRLLLTKAPNQDDIAHDVPPVLHCSAEETLEEGRADLSFVDGEGRWHVITEIKIYAGYGHAQIRRYLSSFHADAERVALIAITRPLVQAAIA